MKKKTLGKMTQTRVTLGFSTVTKVKDSKKKYDRQKFKRGDMR
jgi:hypothetical protein